MGKTNFKKLALDFKRSNNGKGGSPCHLSFKEYVNLLMNEIVIKRTDDKKIKYVDERFIKSDLIHRGCVGYDKIGDRWYHVIGEGNNELGDPKLLIFTTANAIEYQRKASYDEGDDGAYIIWCNASKDFTLAEMIEETTDFMYECNKSAMQNIKACRSPYIVSVNDENLQLSITQAIKQQQDGEPVIVVSGDVANGLKATDITSQFIAPDYIQVRDHERDILLNKIGIVSDSGKREREQSTEINAKVNQATDYINNIIDTFNKQMEDYNIPYTMEFNGSMATLYNTDTNEPLNDDDEVDTNDFEKKGNQEND